jgi:hypothetical protein
VDALAGEFADAADAGDRKKRVSRSARIGAMGTADIFIDAPWKLSV